MHKGKTMLIAAFVFMAPVMSHAGINPKDLIKVSGETKDKCVEYYTYQGSLYCSTKPLMTAVNTAEVIKYEKQNIVFDDRPWKAAWGKKSDNVITVEYVPIGDNINHWHELVTSQFYPSTSNQINSQDFAANIVDSLKESGFNPIITYHTNTPDLVIFEFRIHKPESQIQDELQMIKMTNKGFYVLHYVVKKFDMGEKQRKQWLKRFSKSAIK